MERISNYQLFALVFLYEVGSTLVFGFASTAGRAAWISVLISAFIGILINFVYFTIFKMNPGLTIVEWYQTQFGKWLGVPIAWIFVLELIYDGCRGIADLEIVIPSTVLPRTPIFVVQCIYLAVITYALFSGIEIMARLGELFFPLVVFLCLILIIMIFSSNILNVDYIKPVLGKGWSNIWNSVWPLGITQTFGQTIEFTMLWPLVKKPEKIMRTTFFATILAGLLIAFFDVLAVLGLGENTFSKSIFPVFRLFRLISVGDFFENLDAISILFLLSNSFIKSALHLFNAVRGIQQLTYSKSKIFILTVVIIVLLGGNKMATSSPEHLAVGLKIVPYNLWFPLYYVLPIILLIVTLIRNKFMPPGSYISRYVFIYSLFAPIHRQFKKLSLLKILK